MTNATDVKRELRKFSEAQGVAQVAVVDEAALSAHPEHLQAARRILPGVKSVISFAHPFPKGAMHILKDKEGGFAYYTRMAGLGCRIVDEISCKLSLFLEEKGFSAAPLFVCTPMEMRGKLDMWGYASQIDIAAMGGLGWKGKNGLLISPKYGARVGIGTVLTDAPLEGDAPLDQGCPEGCSACFDACPSKAIDGSGKVNRMTCTVTQGTAPLAIMMAKHFPPKENMDMILNVGSVDEHVWYRCNSCVVNCPIGL